jgi:hypothetical protein
VIVVVADSAPVGTETTPPHAATDPPFSPTSADTDAPPSPPAEGCWSRPPHEPNAKERTATAKAATGMRHHCFIAGVLDFLMRGG